MLLLNGGYGGIHCTIYTVRCRLADLAPLWYLLCFLAFSCLVSYNNYESCGHPWQSFFNKCAHVLWAREQRIILIHTMHIKYSDFFVLCILKFLWGSLSLWLTSVMDILYNMLQYSYYPTCMHRDKVIGLSMHASIITMKITRSRDLGIWAVGISKKLTWMCFERQE